MEQTVFKWETVQGSPERVQWLKENYNKPVTEDEFVEFVRSLPHAHLHASASRRPNYNRRQYQRMKAKFGFFTSEARAE